MDVETNVWKERLRRCYDATRVACCLRARWCGLKFALPLMDQTSLVLCCVFGGGTAFPIWQTTESRPAAQPIRLDQSDVLELLPMCGFDLLEPTWL